MQFDPKIGNGILTSLLAHLGQGGQESYCYQWFWTISLPDNFPPIILASPDNAPPFFCAIPMILLLSFCHRSQYPSRLFAFWDNSPPICVLYMYHMCNNVSQNKYCCHASVGFTFLCTCWYIISNTMSSEILLLSI